MENEGAVRSAELNHALCAYRRSADGTRARIASFSILHLILRVNTGGIRAQDLCAFLIAVLRCAV